MGSLYSRYGLKNTMANKPFSISFIDSFLDCPYKCFMTYIAGLWKDSGSVALKFGSGCHAGLARVNKSLQGVEADICKDCPRECKLNPVIQDASGSLSIREKRKLKRAIRAKALDVPLEECKVKQLLVKEFKGTFTDEFCEATAKDMKDKDPTLTGEDIAKKMAEQNDIALQCMYHATFKEQPIGTILMTEEKLGGFMGTTEITGIVDLCLATEADNGGANLMILDYKTATPGKETEPIRQLCFYTYMLESKFRSMGSDTKVDYVAALHMFKKKKPAKPRVPFKQTDLWYKDLNQCPGLYVKTINEIGQDIDQIQECLDHGIFLKNRRSFSCSYCENKDLCQNEKLFEKALAEKSTSGLNWSKA